MEQYRALKPGNPNPIWYFSSTALDNEIGTKPRKFYDLYYTGGQTKQSYQSLMALKPMDSSGPSLRICKWFIVQLAAQLYIAFSFLSPRENMYNFLILFYTDTLKNK